MVDKHRNIPSVFIAKVFPEETQTVFPLKHDSDHL